MITNYEELTGEQIEAISELVKKHYVKRYNADQMKGSEIYKKLVKSKVITNGVAGVGITIFNRPSRDVKVIRIRSPRIKFVEIEVNEEQYDQLIGVI